jgi:hypothetical protein
MVAELTLFLSTDGMLQVRASKTKSDLIVYCVRDFIRMVSDKPSMRPSDAMIYWMSAACSRELRTEHDIQDQYPIQFLGAYEPKNVCLTASGLLLLFNYIDSRFGFIREHYKEELKQRLVVLAEGGGSEYVYEHDDGEVDAMMAAKDEAIARGTGLDGPPADWPFFFNDPPAPEAAGRLQECMEAITEMGVALESSAVEEVKHDRKTAFSIKDLIGEMELDIEPGRVPALCKTVCTRFREIRPGSDVFSKMRRTFFYQQDRACLESILQEEYMKYVVRRAGEEFEEMGKIDP